MMPSKINFKRAKPALGTVVEIAITEIAWAEGVRASDEAFGEIFRLEKIFNFFDPESEVSRVNAGGIEGVSVSPELVEILRLAAIIQNESGGAFRISPSCGCEAEGCLNILDDRVRRRGEACALDLGGIAKGYIVDRAFEKLAPLFAEHAVIVNAGGDLRASGEAGVELRLPLADGGEKRLAVKVHGQAVATSFREGAPLVGTPSARYVKVPQESSSTSAMAKHPRGATVIADRCAVADALTKVAMFAGAIPQSLATALGVHASWVHS